MRYPAILAVLICSTVSAKPTVDTFLHESWYTFELVVFQHPADESRDKSQDERPHTESLKYAPRLGVILDTLANGKHLGTPNRQEETEAETQSLRKDQPIVPPDWLAESHQLTKEQWEYLMSSHGIDSWSSHQIFNFLQQPSKYVKLSPKEGFLDAVRAFEDSLYSNSYSWTYEKLNLGLAVERLQRHGYRILHHGRWHQPVAAAKKQRLLLQLGNQLSIGVREVEGWIEISKPNFLVVDANLWLFNQANVAVRDENHSHQLHTFYELNEERKMHGNENYYFDHPLIGIILRVEEIKIPQAIQAMLDELEKVGSL